MPIATTDEQRALEATIRRWATTAGTSATVRAREPGAESVGDARSWTRPWDELAGIGIFAIGVPTGLGGAGGDLVDVAVAVEQAARALAPGPVPTTVLAALVLAEHPDLPLTGALLPGLVDGRVSVAAPLGEVGVLDATDDPGGGLLVNGTVGPVLGTGDASHLLLPAGERWFVVAADAPGITVTDGSPLDFSRGLGHVRADGLVVAAENVLPAGCADRIAGLAVTIAVAEAAGVADWCLRTATDHARVREQFGRPIGSFQAVKHLCADMLCRVEEAVALAWDAARAGGDGPAQHAVATSAAAALALDAAVDTAKDCVQVLGGIGFTWEHDAHLYLRRALALRQLLGGAPAWRRRSARLALAGDRRRLDTATDLTRADDPADSPDGSQADDVRTRVRTTVAGIAALPETQRRAALADAGYLTPHWPAPHGLDASPADQLLIDEELAAAGLRRPDLVIGGWAVPTILAHGTPQQCERFAGPTLRGDITWCQLFSEPGAGSDLASLRTKAERTDDGWLLSGQKVWTSLAADADWAICLARTDAAAPRHQGISYFLVDMRSAGIDIRPLREITGDAMFNEVFLDDVFVPTDCLVGPENGGWPLTRTTLANERVAMGGGSSLDEGVEELLALLVAGGRADDVVEHERIGALTAQGTATALLDLRTTLRALDGREPGPESSVRKLVGVAHRQAVAELALDLLGPAGAAPEGPLAVVAHEFLLTRCLSIAGGTTQILRTVVAERILGLPR
jgi:alkylation response protein AidB-like acyl-CoA dehydrogenase